MVCLPLVKISSVTVPGSVKSPNTVVSLRDLLSNIATIDNAGISATTRAYVFSRLVSVIERFR